LQQEALQKSHPKKIFVMGTLFQLFTFTPYTCNTIISQKAISINSTTMLVLNSISNISQRALGFS